MTKASKMVSELTYKGLAFLWLACSQTLASFSGLDCKQAKTGARESLGTSLLRPQEMLLHMHIYVVFVLKQAFQHTVTHVGSPPPNIKQSSHGKYPTRDTRALSTTSHSPCLSYCKQM